MSFIVGLCCSAMLLSISSLAWFVLGPASFGEAASASIMDGGYFWAFFFGVLVVPIFENVVAILLPVELARKVGLGPGVAIAICATLFSLGHGLNGGAGHAVTTFVGGSIFASVYLARRDDGIGSALLASWIAHATSNFAVMFFWIPVISFG
jgi:hypothetical protein